MYFIRKQLKFEKILQYDRQGFLIGQLEALNLLVLDEWWNNIITFGKLTRDSFTTFFTIEWHNYVYINSRVWISSAFMKQNRDFLEGPKEFRGT